MAKSLMDKVISPEITMACPPLSDGAGGAVAWMMRGRGTAMVCHIDPQGCTRVLGYHTPAPPASEIAKRKLPDYVRNLVNEALCRGTADEAASLMLQEIHRMVFLEHPWRTEEDLKEFMSLAEIRECLVRVTSGTADPFVITHRLSKWLDLELSEATFNLVKEAVVPLLLMPPKPESVMKVVMERNATLHRSTQLARHDEAALVKFRGEAIALCRSLAQPASPAAPSVGHR